MIQISKLSSPTSYFVIRKRAQQRKLKQRYFQTMTYGMIIVILLLFWFTVWRQKIMGEVTGDDYKEQIEHCIC